MSAGGVSRFGVENGLDLGGDGRLLVRRGGGFAQVQHQVALAVHVAVAAGGAGGRSSRQQEVEDVGLGVPLNLGRVEVAQQLGQVLPKRGELGNGGAERRGGEVRRQEFGQDAAAPPPTPPLRGRGA